MALLRAIWRIFPHSKAVYLLPVWLLLSGCVEEILPPREGAFPIIDDRRNPLVLIETTKGNMRVELFEDDATNTVNYFIYLIENMPRVFWNQPVYYADDIRIEAGPRGAIAGFRIKKEVTRHGHKRYSLAVKGMSGGWLSTDIVLTRADAFDLDKANTVIGRVVEGTSVVNKLQRGDRIRTIRVIRKRSHEYIPVAYGSPMRFSPYRRKRH